MDVVASTDHSDRHTPHESLGLRICTSTEAQRRSASIWILSLSYICVWLNRRFGPQQQFFAGSQSRMGTWHDTNQCLLLAAISAPPYGQVSLQLLLEKQPSPQLDMLGYRETRFLNSPFPRSVCQFQSSWHTWVCRRYTVADILGCVLLPHLS